MPADSIQDGAGNVLARAPKSQYIPEIINSSGAPHAGPFVQIEGHGGDCVITSMTVADSDTTWAGVTVFNGKPIEGYFTAITPVDELLVYRKRA